MSEKSKKIQVSVSLPHKLFCDLEKVVNGKTRSEVIRDLLEKSIKEVDKRKKNGVVYTPKYLAEYVSNKIINYFNVNISCTKKTNCYVLDPACGEGILLQSIKTSLINKRIDCKYVGIDIDNSALKKAKKNLTKNFYGFNTNALCPFNNNRFIGWDKINNNLGNGNGFDLIIANPPWGADISNYKKWINKEDYQMLYGQYDTSDLFIELSISLLKENGVAGLIIPDSLFSHDRAQLRKLLLDNTKILFIGRFGEKIFKDINRACAVVIFQKRTNFNEPYEIDCFRLPAEEKNNVINGTNTLSAIEKKYLHKVAISRFNVEPDYLFNLDIDSTLEKTYQKIASNKNKLGDYLDNHRGVELSKKGKIIQCSSCELWSPLPKGLDFTCKSCGKKRSIDTSISKVIIHKSFDKDFYSIIVGEDINRYKINHNFWIDISNSGVNYKKTTIYKGDKIVVRKTGIGISASIDYTSSYTNQVVYIFKLKREFEKKIPLEFLLAILNSRAIFFFISMSNGEIEWKSHPYLTQKQIINVPIPDLNKLHNEDICSIYKLSNCLKDKLKNNMPISPNLDARIEKLVAKLYGLDFENYQAIFKALDKAQELIAVKVLKNISPNDVFGIKE